jgi:uncharacterized membrane protein
MSENIREAPEQDPTGQSEVDGVMRRNIQALLEVRRRMEQKKGREETIADAITSFAGSLTFVYLHAAIFGGWILVNLRAVPGIEPFDPFPFVMLAMIASVEAIFLSTFVLISQNRMAAMADRRADLDLQVNLLAEHEITRLIQLVDAIALHLDVHVELAPGFQELKKDVRPEAVLEEIARAEQGHESLKAEDRKHR